MTAVTQEWTHSLTMMQQTVLLTAIRGPDGVEKLHPVKYVLRWLRRCVLTSAMDRRVLTTPFDRGGGSFNGPSCEMAEWAQATGSFESYGLGPQGWMDRVLMTRVLDGIDVLPHHFFVHMMQASQIIGYKHPTRETREWWHRFYCRLCDSMHVIPEAEARMDRRLGDTVEGHGNEGDRAYDAAKHGLMFADHLIEWYDSEGAPIRDAHDGAKTRKAWENENLQQFIPSEDPLKREFIGQSRSHAVGPPSVALQNSPLLTDVEVEVAMKDLRVRLFEDSSVHGVMLITQDHGGSSAVLFTLDDGRVVNGDQLEVIVPGVV